MLYDMLMNQPQTIGTIVRHTPTWVWGLLAGLIALGLSQVRDRIASLQRILLMPVAMTAFSLWGMSTALGASPMFGYVMLMWTFVFAVTFATLAMVPPPAGARYDASARTFALRGSWVPLVLILGIFLTRYWVNVEVAIAPALVRDGQYTLAVGAIYGLFGGIFAGRAARLAKLALPFGTAGLRLQRDPWQAP